MAKLMHQLLQKCHPVRWLLALVLAAGFAAAVAQQVGRNFDHFSTGFPLSGQHATTRCESCHTNGVFQGTPRTCSSCHVSGSPRSIGNVVKPANHFQTQLECSSCHNMFTFAGARFDHLGVSPTACASCHNNIVQPGKPFGHIVTDVTCSQCHSTRAWLPATSTDHNTFTPTTVCVTCHNGTSAQGKIASHIPTAANCSTCHTYSPKVWSPSTWDHSKAVVANRCSSCHSGAYTGVVGPTFNHIPYGSLSGVAIANCDTCHKAGYTSFAPGVFHTNVSVSSQCATCHLTTNYAVTGKPSTATHASITGTCENCHTNTTDWLATKPNHAVFTSATNCSNCHNGTTATGKNANTHMPTALNCASCHDANASTWRPSSWNHTQTAVSGQCATCHTGGYPPADGKTGNHIPYASVTGVAIANCDTCHKGGYSSWNPGRFHANVSVSTQCATCHATSTYGITGVSSTPIHSGVTTNCESCHSSTSSWFGAKPNHSAYTNATSCTTCHNGSTATGQSATHFPTSGTNCVSCHSATGTTWKPSTWNHTQMTVINTCATCHSGAFAPADGTHATHIPYLSVTASSGANCDTCHRGGYVRWNPGLFHSNITVTTQCSSCHLTTGYGLTGKPSNPTHASASNNCENCHNPGTWFLTAKPNHAVYTPATDCTTCHNGTTALGKSVNHMVTSLNCASCHSWTQTTFRPSTWNHTQQSVTNCSSCHDGTHALGITSNHIPTTGAANCSTCHSGYVSFRPSTWNHTNAGVAVASACATCHTGTKPPADGKPGTHVDYTSVATATNCDTCHKGGYTTWFPGRVHSNHSVSTGCHSCHLNGGPGVTAKPSTVIHTGVTTGCESCHTSTSSWLGAKPNHSGFTVATNCLTCHAGSGGATKQNATHFPTSSTNCIACHSATLTIWRPTSWNHTQMSVANCSTCHTGTYAPADGRTANHIPYATLAGTSSCDACHKGGYTNWFPGRLHINVSVTSSCESCHLTTTYGLTAKPSTSVHTGVVSGCESCHNTSAWTGAKPNHAQFTAATDCTTCHNGTTALGKPGGTHITTALNCVQCHSATLLSFRPSTWNHTQQSVTNCSSCHNGTMAIGVSGTHIPTTGAANCSTCHSSSSFVSFKPSTWNHTNAGVTVANNCSTCHAGVGAGTYPPADGKTATHINYTSVATATNCDSCHKGGYVSWYPGRVHSNHSIIAQCESCHLVASSGVTGKPSTAIHSGVTTNCQSCHTSTSSWLGAKPDHTAYTGATNCITCHNGSTATGQSSTHFPTAVNCVNCHSATGAIWKPTTWNHTQDTTPVTARCATCHTGTYAPADGKTANHIPYQSVTASASANCDTCHKGGYASWNPGLFHANVTPVTTQCATCHLTAAYGVTAKPSTAVHATVTGNCQTCHNTTSWFLSTRPDHSGYTSATVCSTCHNGTTALAKNTNHIITTLECGWCHTPTQSTFKPSTWNHTQQSVTNCSGCHDGTRALGKAATHIPTTGAANCSTCHGSVSFVSFKLSPAWTHSYTGVTVVNACATCHSGAFPPADGKTSNHVPYQSLTGVAISNCDTCHKAGYAAWNPGRFHSNVSITTQCATCHLTSAYAVTAKPSTAIHASVTGNCESCHTSTSTWFGAKPNHSAYTTATVCTTCHNGTTATGKNSTHFPTTVNCVSCHSATLTIWKPSTWNHTQMPVTNQCSTCHTGTFAPADGKTSNHIPYATLTGVAITNCNSCHKGGYITWNPGKFHTNISITTQCATCHLTTTYGLTGKPSTALHSTVTGSCETCHKSTASWLTVTYAHAPGNAVGTKTCNTCHNGTTAKGKTGTHIPTSTASCDECHSSQVSFATSVVMQHGPAAILAMTCKACHNGGYVSEGTQYGGAKGKPTNHIPEAQLLNGAAMDCGTCHNLANKTSASGWIQASFNKTTLHNGSQGNGSGWCKACHVTGTNYLGNMQRFQLNHRGGTSVKTDCSQSGCHRPIGNTGTSWSKWN